MPRPRTSPGTVRLTRIRLVVFWEGPIGGAVSENAGGIQQERNVASAGRMWMVTTLETAYLVALPTPPRLVANSAMDRYRVGLNGI